MMEEVVGVSPYEDAGAGLMEVRLKSGLGVHNRVWAAGCGVTRGHQGD